MYSAVGPSVGVAVGLEVVGSTEGEPVGPDVEGFAVGTRVGAYVGEEVVGAPVGVAVVGAPVVGAEDVGDPLGRPVVGAALPRHQFPSFPVPEERRQHSIGSKAPASQRQRSQPGVQEGRTGRKRKGGKKGWVLHTGAWTRVTQGASDAGGTGAVGTEAKATHRSRNIRCRRSHAQGSHCGCSSRPRSESQTRIAIGLQSHQSAFDRRGYEVEPVTWRVWGGWSWEMRETGQVGGNKISVIKTYEDKINVRWRRWW